MVFWGLGNSVDSISEINIINPVFSKSYVKSSFFKIKVGREFFLLFSPIRGSTVFIYEKADGFSNAPSGFF